LVKGIVLVDISIIYVNWNCAEEIIASIDSVYRHCEGASIEIIVVDNDSAEGTGGLERDDIRLILNQENSGFGAGCNLGARQASGQFLLFLNPDTLILNNIFTKSMDFLKEHPETGAIGPMTLETDGTIHYGAGKSFPTLFFDFLEHSTITFRYPKNRILGAPYYSFWDHKSTRTVDTLLGACMMFRKDVFEAINGFDETFFLYYEEVDLCKRTWMAGYNIFYLHDCLIIHKGKKSTTKRYGHVDKMIFQYLESAYIYFLKHHGQLYASIWKKMISGIYLVRYLKKRKPVFFSYFKWGVKGV
jgi:GT2 family glycosyltransferase